MFYHWSFWPLVVRARIHRTLFRRVSRLRFRLWRHATLQDEWSNIGFLNALILLDINTRIHAAFTARRTDIPFYLQVADFDYSFVYKRIQNTDQRSRYGMKIKHVRLYRSEAQDTGGWGRYGANWRSRLVAPYRYSRSSSCLSEGCSLYAMGTEAGSWRTRRNVSCTRIAASLSAAVRCHTARWSSCNVRRKNKESISFIIASVTTTYF